LDYDKEKITPEIISNYEKKIKCNESYNYEAALKANFALSFLYKWCDAMYEFDKTFRETAPLRAKLEAAEKIVREKTAELKEKKDALDEINRMITELENLFNSKMAE
jgi:dynein heavy chain